MTCMKIARASAPAKVMLFGEHFVVYGCPAILGSIDKRVSVTAKQTESAKINISSNMGFLASYSSESLEKPGPQFSEAQNTLYPIYAAVHDVLRDHFEADGRHHGVEIDIKSDIPWGAGLGSSAASCVASVGAVKSLFLKPEKEWVYSRALGAERIIHENSSGADCNISTFGGLIYYIKDTRNKKISSKAELSLVVLITGIKHSTRSQVSFVKNFRNQNRSLFNDLASRATRVCDKAVSAIRSGDIIKLGELMNENHMLLKDLGVSNDEINDLIRFCLDNGATGAKLTGAGGGGSVVALLSNENQASFIRKMGKKGFRQYFPVRIGSYGLLIE
jgi:mevalonate kinase